MELDHLERDAAALEHEIESLRDRDLRELTSRVDSIRLELDGGVSLAEERAQVLEDAAARADRLNRELSAERALRARAETGLQENRFRLAELELAVRGTAETLEILSRGVERAREELRAISASDAELERALRGLLDRFGDKGATPVTLEAGRLMVERWYDGGTRADGLEGALERLARSIRANVVPASPERAADAPTSG
jgi:chromosome segregation ATPase